MSFAEGLVGITLDGRYRLEAVLGEGGMGAVYRATHLAMERKVAVKLLKPHLTTDTTALQRFAREARSTLRVESPHAVKVLDFGVTPMNDYYMVLEYLDGRTVQRELDIDGCFTPARAVHIARQALQALGTAHAIGLVHRDIKPDNLLLMKLGQDPDYTKVLDFGVAKMMEGAAREAMELALTQAGTVFGTPELMSPEQACGHALDGRSDLYSLAATLFAMLTGRGLFDAATPIEWLTSHVRTPPPHLAEVSPELARYPELDAVLQRCLAKHRDNRPRTAAELDALLAKLEPTLSRAPGETPTSRQVALFSGSSFFSVLPEDLADPERDAPSALVSPSESAAPAVGRGRGLYLVLGALAVVATIGIAVTVVASRSSRTASIPDARVMAALPPDPPALDAAPADAPAPAVDAPRRPGDAGTSRPAHAAPDPHLEAAEAALQSNNRLRQLAEADLALRANPRNVRARYLLADALLKSGDSTRGCEYLQTLKRYRPAVARARQAGCGID
ncbi:MAG: protein kinase [Kofleriaceae bacterium]